MPGSVPGSESYTNSWLKAWVIWVSTFKYKHTRVYIRRSNLSTYPSITKDDSEHFLFIFIFSFCFSKMFFKKNIVYKELNI